MVLLFHVRCYLVKTNISSEALMTKNLYINPLCRIRSTLVEIRIVNLIVPARYAMHTSTIGEKM